MELGPDEIILDQPRIYIGDGSTGTYSNPDFAIYNTKTNKITRIIDAKDGGGGYTVRQVELNEQGGTFYGTKRNPNATKKIIGAGGIKVDPGIVEQKRTNVTTGQTGN